MWSRIVAIFPDLVIFMATALIFGVIRILLMPDKRGFADIMTVLVICIPVGTLVGWWMLTIGLPDPLALIICSACSLLSEKIVNFILNNWEYFSGLLKRAGENLTDKWTK